MANIDGTEKGVRGMDYRDLSFYQKARQVTLLINSELKTWPKSMQAQEIARQLFRASTSISATIAEGHGRHIRPEFMHFLITTQGSANEVDNWLNTTVDCGIGNSDTINHD